MLLYRWCQAEPIFFVSPDGKAARAAGLFPGIWQIGGVWRTFTIHLSAQSLHNQHRRIQNSFQYIVTYHNAEQRRARKGGARGGKAGFVTPSAFPPRKPAHCSSVPLKGKRPLPKCPPEREPLSAQERTSDARPCTISGTIFSLILSIVHSLVYYKEHTSNLLTLKSESVILWSS